MVQGLEELREVMKLLHLCNEQIVLLKGTIRQILQIMFMTSSIKI